MLFISLKYSCIVFNIRTSQNRKVQSFGATNQSSNIQEVSSSSSSSKTEGTQTDAVSNRPSTSEANNRQEAEDVNEDCSDITVQDQPVQATDEQENREGEQDQGAVNVAMNEGVNIMKNAVDKEPSYQVRSK